MTKTACHGICCEKREARGQPECDLYAEMARRDVPNKDRIPSCGRPGHRPLYIPIRSAPELALECESEGGEI